MKRVHRRTVLQGLGCTLALPWLESVSAGEKVSGFAPAAGEPPRRLGVVFMPNGAPMDTWKASKTEKGLELGNSLKPLEPYFNQVVLPFGLWNVSSRDGGGSHAPRMNLLSGVRVKRSVTDLELSTTMDQVIAQQIGKQTALESLVTACEAPSSGNDHGFSGVYMNHISWQSPETPVPTVLQPADVFDMLFGSNQNKNEQLQKSVLDRMGGRLQNLRQQVTTSDKRRLEEYLTNVRLLEARIAQLEETRKSFPTHKPTRERPADEMTDIKLHQELMLELMATAFQIDRTRVATCMLGMDISRIQYSFIDGVRSTHHEASHGIGGSRGMYGLITQYLVKLFTEQLIARLAKIQEGDGVLLDHCMLLMASSMSEGAGHDPRNLPVILAGKGGGTIKTGQILILPEEKNKLCRLYLSIMHRMGVKLDSFADADSELTEIDA